MKNIITKLLKVFVIVMMVSFAYSAEAQPPPPPGGSTGTGNNTGNSQGGTAPIGGGLFILLGLGAAYGGRKLYQLQNDKSIDS